MTEKTTEAVIMKPADLMKMSKIERIALVYKARVAWPRQEKILSAIEEIFDESGLSPEPQCLAVFGKFGTSKSTIIDMIYEGHPRYHLDDRTVIPILRVVVPAIGSPNNLLIAILSALGDPTPHIGNNTIKMLRLKKLIHECGVKMILFDESNHLVDLMNVKVLHHVTNTLKNLLKETRISCVLVGLPYTEEILLANGQLGSLFGDPIMIEPFEYDSEFTQMVREIENLMPLAIKGKFSNADLTWRVYIASGGRMRYLMKLLRSATKICIKENIDGYTLDVLSQAFEINVAGERRGISNPFVGMAPKSYKEPIDNYLPPSLKDKYQLPKRKKRKKK
ncbi:MAG: hypothetical protein Phog2KO_46060 [Phototrophicaceae bacterium]